MDFNDLYKRLAKATVKNKLEDEVNYINEFEDDNTKEKMKFLINPEDSPLIIQSDICSCSTNDKAACEVACLFDAIKRDENGKLVITSKCTGCGKCIEACTNHTLIERKEIIPIIELLNKKEMPVYAMIAPAFSGQFNEKVTSGKLRSAFKCLGFYGMIEVALFADVLTLKEALEFDRSIKNDKDFLLTSCCCPIWVAMIKRNYSSLIPHVPPSVSPMVACGRAIKKMHPGAITVFIGPCIAKKAEAKESDIKDAVDYVLTFEEINNLFNIYNLDLENLPEDSSDHSSRAGRIYARVTGVSEAVKATLERLRPDRKIPLISKQADGVLECKNLLKQIINGEINANFIEGMGCKGGCVGGPKALIDKEEAKIHVDKYGEDASYKTPADNKYVLSILEKLGFNDIDNLLDNDTTFTRDFNNK